MKAARLVWIGVATGLILVAIIFLWPGGEDARLQSKARKKWGDQAIADISRRVSNPLALTNEMAALRAASVQAAEDWWIGTNILLMGDGKYLVYADINAKEEGRIHDLFIAYGSDDKWYYSTYHFCTGMVSIRVAEQPASIRAFAETYFAREFDGTSDECLKKTWPLKR